MTQGTPPNLDLDRVQVRIGKELKQEAFALCYAENKSLSLVVRDLLEGWVEETRKAVARNPRKSARLANYKEGDGNV